VCVPPILCCAYHVYLLSLHANHSLYFKTFIESDVNIGLVKKLQEGVRASVNLDEDAVGKFLLSLTCLVITGH
jgi:hypothetical protein